MSSFVTAGGDIGNGELLAQNAQDTANDANAKNSANSQQIANINDPNYLTPFEKPQLEIQMDNFATIYKTDKDIATAEGIDFTSYGAAYHAYVAYMTPLIADMTTYSPIVRATFNSMVVAVQTEQKRFSTATQAQYNQQIKKAQTDIDDGQTKYEALQSEAETMKSSVAGISDVADRAISSAGFASNAASTASQAASSAVASAASAESDANVALNQASSAVSKAESTASAFSKVDQKADSAVASAASAESNASSAVAQASSAAADSKDAKQIAGAVSQSYKTLTDGSTMTIAELESGLAAKLTKTDLNGYSTQAWTQNQLKMTADGINGTMSSIKGTVDKHTTSINDLKADSRGFKDQFTKVNGTVGKHTTDIGSLQADSSGFKSQFDTVNDTLGKHTTDIGTLQSTSKELSSNFDSLNTENGTNKHDISQLQQTAKEVSSTLETVKTQVQNSAVGTNLLLNTSDYSNNWNWNVTPSIDTTQMPAILHYPSTTLTSGVSVIAQQNIGTILQPSTTYTASFYAKGSGSFIFYCYPGVAATVSSVNGIVPPSASSDCHTTIPLTSNYVRYTITFTTLSSISNTKNFLLRQDYNSSDPSYNTVEAYVYGMKLEKGSVETDWSLNPTETATVTALTKVKQTADSAQVLATNNHGDLAKLQVTAKGLQSTVSDKASSDQLTQLSDQLTNKISDLSSSTSSQFTHTASDINNMVKKGDVVNQFNIDAGGALLSTSGNSTKIVFSAPNIIFDSTNPVQIPNANIPGTLTGKTFEAGTITATTKIKGADIEAPIIHSPSGSFKLDGSTGDIIGASIHSSDGSWGITANGKISGASVTSSMIDISGDGSGPDFDAENITPDTTTGIYSRYKYNNPNVGFDVSGFGRKMYKNGYLVINGDTFLNRTIGDWSADGGGKYVYDTMYEANVIKMRAYNYTGSNVQTDDPSSTEGSISSRLDIQPSAITMGRDWSVGNPNILIDGDGLLKVGTIAINGHHSMGTTDGSDMYFMKMNKDATDVSGTSIPIHAARYYTANMGISGGHVINSYDGHDVYLEDKWGSGGNMVSLHVKKLYNSSLLSLKTDITTIDPNDALETIANTDFRSYRFKTDDPSEPKSVSPILDDENQIPIYNTPNIFKSADGKSRNDGNILGYTALSVQALYAKIKDLTTRLQKLEGAN